ncbi:L-rhamnose mutarotase [Amycolatopsis nigrescens]|uniref:L-rhamnose mutarotase n=1 Tax=Amycolatopsis nigrescens TaxID=381445 RepID=UPI000361F4E3|nr:L-rhamnose mutarotase [Amycolatopsis nigrescens]
MTQRVALHTRLKPGREAEYERVHAVIPDELDALLTEAGVRSWRIWRDGLDLFHVVEVDDYAAMRAKLAGHPVELAWQARMAELLDEDEGYSVSDGSLGLVWEKP